MSDFLIRPQQLPMTKLIQGHVKCYRASGYGDGGWLRLQSP